MFLSHYITTDICTGHRNVSLYILDIEIFKCHGHLWWQTLEWSMVDKRRCWSNTLSSLLDLKCVFIAAFSKWKHWKVLILLALLFYLFICLFFFKCVLLFKYVAIFKSTFLFLLKFFKKVILVKLLAFRIKPKAWDLGCWQLIPVILTKKI